MTDAKEFTGPHPRSFPLEKGRMPEGLGTSVRNGGDCHTSLRDVRFYLSLMRLDGAWSHVSSKSSKDDFEDDKPKDE